jgi:hypothetical protein
MSIDSNRSNANKEDKEESREPDYGRKGGRIRGKHRRETKGRINHLDADREGLLTYYSFLLYCMKQTSL